MIYSVVGEENIQVKTEVKILSRSPALSMTECLAGARVESCQRGPAADLRRLRVGRQVDHARLDEAAQRRPQPRQPGEEQVATEEPDTSGLVHCCTCTCLSLDMVLR